MKHLIVMLAEVTSVIAFAATVEKSTNTPSPTAVMCVEKAPDDGGIARAQRKAMTPEERTATKKKANRKAAEKTVLAAKERRTPRKRSKGKEEMR